MEINDDIRARARRRITDRNALNQYIEECIKGEVCPQCGKDLRYDLGPPLIGMTSEGCWRCDSCGWSHPTLVT